ncbi:MAG: helix-turn-helix domain-containing protein [bacterium]|nr:helix-turn-helix domain-containing protein [bacterium]
MASLVSKTYIMELEDRLYASTEVAKILGVSRRTLYRYLESGTLGSMHLPSGRHRFTKDQVEAFLVKTYGANNLKIVETAKPTVVAEVQTTVEIKSEPELVIEDRAELDEEVIRPSIFSKIKAEVEEAVVEEEVVVEEKLEVVEEEEKEEEEEVEKLEVVEDQAQIDDEDDVDEVVEDLKKTLSSLFDDSDDVKPTPVTKSSAKDSFNFYSSSISDLKKLAKTVKVASENSNVQYAFTGQAGASLFGEVSPFGQLHLYIRKNDMLFFEKRFDLEETIQDESNVALKVVDELPEHTIVMGFKVVNLPTLKKDLIQLGDSATAGNLEG